MFAGKHGLITPRDLFKWAQRGAISYQELAENGTMLLGERLRSQAERGVVQHVLEKIMNVKVASHAKPLPCFKNVNKGLSSTLTYALIIFLKNKTL